MLVEPVRKGMSKTEWAAWNKADDEHFNAKNDWTRSAEGDTWEYREYMRQRTEALAWAAPPHVKLVIHAPPRGEDVGAVLKVVQLARDSTVSARALVDEACASVPLRRDDFHWLNTKPSSVAAMSDRAAESSAHLLHQPDTALFPSLWHPFDESDWESEHVYRVTICAKPKAPPAAPTEQPRLDLLKSPPPAGDASVAEWDAWREANIGCGGLVDRLQQAFDAIRCQCPPVVPVHIKGLSHAVTVDAAADAPLAAAVAAFCAAAPPTAAPLSPSDLLLQYSADGQYVDQQTKSARDLFTGASRTRNLTVVYRDAARTQSDVMARLGDLPECYDVFKGDGFLVGVHDTPWFASAAHGFPMLQKVIDGAISLHTGYDFELETGYDPIAAWWKMTKKLKAMIQSAVREPNGGWSAESVERALDTFTGLLLAMASHDRWMHDARGKIMMWDPKCRKESISIIRKLDAAAAGLVAEALRRTATGGAPSAEPGSGAWSAGLIGVPRWLAQTERLLDKVQDTWDGWSEDGDNHKGYLAFKKSLALFV